MNHSTPISLRQATLDTKLRPSTVGDDWAQPITNRARSLTKWLVVLFSLFLSMGQLTAQSTTCEEGMVENGNSDLWSEECYLNDTCGLQGNPCQASDVRLVGVFLADSMGNPLPACNVGETTTVVLWGIFNNNTRTNRYSIRARTEVIINGSFSTELSQCAFDVLPPGIDSFAILGTINYTCGDQIQLLNTWIAWNTTASQCGDPDGANYAFDCGDYSPAKCSKNLGYINFLGADFSYACGGASSTTTTLCFTDQSIGAEGPIVAWDWDFGDGGVSTEQNPCHVYNATSGMFTITLMVTDSAGNMGAVFVEVLLDTLSCCELSVTCPPANGGTFNCPTQIPLPNPNLVVINNSCGDVTISVQDQETGSLCSPGMLTHTRLYIVNDGVNIDTCTQTFTVIDNQPPVITCPPNVTVQCNASTTPPNTGGSATAIDCTPTTVSFSDATTAGNCPQAYTITRTWTATDACGNTSTCSQLIAVLDNAGPTVNCPPNITVQCDASTAPGSTGQATATDACDNGPLSITNADVLTPGNCLQAYTITRTFTATDACGNTGTCVQTISVVDGTPPVLNCPADATISCDEDSSTSNTGVATVSDNCDAGPFVITSSDVITSGACPQSSLIERTFLVADACGNSSTCVQMILVVDQTAPALNCPADVTINCDEDSSEENTGMATASDNCDAGPFAITIADEIISGACPQSYVIERTFLVGDACGNTTTCLQTITVVDAVAPVISCPADVTISCDDDSDPASTGVATASDNCDAGPVSITASDEIVSGACPQSYSIERTFTATDACGNSSTCMQTISVIDNIAPVITCPADVTLECGEDTSTGNTGDATVSDNCDAGPFAVTISDVMTSGACPNSYTITRTFLTSDACGHSATCEQIITVEDHTPPVITCPVDVTLECGDDTSTDFTGTAGITDNCDPGPFAVTISDVMTSGACPQSFTIERTFFVADACGNSSSCTQLISVADATPPVLTCPANVTLECGDDTSTSSTGMASASDNCDTSPLVVTNSDVVASEECPDNFTITRTFFVADACGNSSTCVQMIAVRDNTAPVVSCPEDIVIECGDSTDPDNTGMVSATDACDPQVTVTYFDSPEAPPVQGPAVRWVFMPPGVALGNCESGTDCSTNTICFALEYTPGTTGNLTSYTTGFLVDCYNGSDPVVYNQSCVFNDNSLVTEDCGGSGLVLMNSSGNTGNLPITQNVPVYVHQICFQLGALAVVNIEEDVITNITTSIDLPGGGQTSEEPDFITYTVNYDDFCPCYYPYDIYRTFTVTDECGNSATCQQHITIQDTTPPVIDCVAPVSPVECPGTPEDFPVVTATDACDANPTLTFEDVTIDGACPQEYTVTRTWTATDACGNSSTCVQSVLVDDSTPPTLVCPADVTLDCGDDTSTANTGLATATDICDGGPLVIIDSDLITSGACPQAYTIERTFFVADACGNSATCVQTITVKDTTPPVITCPADVTLECGDDTTTGNTGMATASDDCDTSPLVVIDSDVITSGECPDDFTITRTFFVADACGNSATCVQTISVQDNLAPVVTCPDDIVIECGDSIDPDNTGMVSATDACDPQVTISYFDSPEAPPVPGPSVRWVFMPPGVTLGACESGTDCSTNTICFALEYTPGTTGNLTSYTTGFLVDCYNGNDPVVYNQSCVFNDNSLVTEDCGGTGLVLMNSSGNTGNLPVTQNVPVLVHQVCFQLGALAVVNIEEDIITNITTSIDLPGGGQTSEEPDFITYTVNYDDYCPCYYPYEIYRTFTVTDECGNSATCQQLITIQDTTPPVIDCVAPISPVECPATPEFPDVTVTDACDANPILTFEDMTLAGECPQEYSITRTWTATDACGNSSTCEQTVVVEDSTPPTLTCPADLTLDCSDDTSTANTGLATASDACDNGPLVILDSDLITPGACPQSYTIERTFFVADACGNSSTCVQTITVRDSTPPVLTCPVDVTIECDEDSSTSGTGMASATDNCDTAPLVIINSDLITSGACPQSYTIARTFFVADACGNSTTCVQSITVRDTNPPVITCPADITIECDESIDPENTGQVSATDACGDVMSTTYSDSPEAGSAVGPLMRWIFMPPGTTLGACESGTDCSTNTICFALEYTPGITGNLTSYTTGFLIDCYNGNDPVVYNQSCVFNDNSLTTEDCAGTGLVLMNSSGNTGNMPVTQNVPVYVHQVCFQLGAGAVINLEEDIITNITTSLDLPGGGQTSEEPDFEPYSVAYDTYCPCYYPYDIYRTFTVTDECGNSATCQQRITLVDTTPPVITCVTPVSPIECPATPEFPDVIVTDACDASPVVTFVDVTIDGQCPQAYTVVRTWTATDGCGNSSTCEQSVVVEDNNPPTLVCPADVTLDCSDDTSTANTGVATASDACDAGPLVVIDSDLITSGACPQSYTIERTFFVADACGNSSTCVQTITVMDTTPPVLTCPADVTIECDEDSSTTGTGMATATDDCDAGPLVIIDSDVITSGNCPGQYTIVRTFFVADACGNSTTCSQVISVTDTTPPVVSCPDDVTIECDESLDPETTGLVSATDACSEVTVEYSDSPFAQNAEGPLMRWVFMPPGTTLGACESGSDCSTNTICFALEYTPGITGNLTSYTTGFLINCYNGNDPVVYNQSCVFNDNSLTTEDCAGTGLVLMNSSGNTGNMPVTQNVPVYVHQVCFQLGAGAVINLEEDVITNITTSLDLPGGGETSEEPDFEPYTVNYDDYCPCFYPYDVYRTFTVTDECGNSTTCQQHITVVDTTPPVITCVAPESPIECTETPEFPVPTATDNCNTSPILTFEDDTIPGACPQEYIVTRTWTAEDGCGNSATCSQSVLIEDTTPPTFAVGCQLVFDFFTSTPGVDCPLDATISIMAGDIIGESENWTVAGQVIPSLNGCLFDNCSPQDSLVARVDSIPVTGNNCTRTFTVYFTIIDQCGNESVDQFICVVNVHDDVAPVLTCPGDVTIECSAATTPDNTGMATATDDCQPEVTIFSSDEVIPGECPQEMTILRTWTADDGCDNVSTCVQTISVMDTVPPTFAVGCQLVFDFFTSTPGVDCPLDATISIMAGDIVGENENWTVAGQVIPSLNGCLFDNCTPQDSLVARVDSIQVTGNNCTRTFTVYFTIVDQCGNESVDQFICVVNVHDDVAPLLTCPGDITIECLEATTPDNTGMATATDDCQPEVTIFSSDEVIPGECPQEMTILRTWTADDGCDNVSTCVQTITVVDTIPPVLVCPADVTIQCDEDSSTDNTGLATASDACDAGPLVIIDSDVITSGNCPQQYTIARTFFVADACGNSSTCVQTITVIDTIAPVLVCPADVTIQCDEDSSTDNTGIATATDNCDAGPLLVTSSDVTIEGGCPQSYDIERTFFVSDACGNSTTCVQLISVRDTVPPTFNPLCQLVFDYYTEMPFIDCPADAMISLVIGQIIGENENWTAGGAVIPSLSGCLFDNCTPQDSLRARVEDLTITGDSCTRTFTVSFRILDQCGNESVDLFVCVVNIHDNVPPVLTCPDDLTLSCGDDTSVDSTGIATATDDCQLEVIVMSSDSIVPGNCGFEQTIYRTWTAEDGCGNTSSCTQTITVRDDVPPDFDRDCQLMLDVYTSTDSIDCPADAEISLVVGQVLGENETWTVGGVTMPSFDGCLSDNCTDPDSLVARVEFIIITGTSCDRTFEVYFRIVDQCGNESAALFIHQITFHDDVAPVITCPSDVTINCDESTDPDNTGMATATDDCQTAVTILSSDVVVPGECPQEMTIIRTWTADDGCDNVSTCVQTIFVQDTTPPTFAVGCQLVFDFFTSTPGVECPEVAEISLVVGQIVSANENWTVAGQIIPSLMGCLFDNCTPPDSLLARVDSIDITGNSCDRTFTVFFTIIDQCGNESADQFICVVNVHDDVAPVLTCPGDVTINCDESTDPDNTGIATATDDCQSEVTIFSTDEVIPGECPQEMTILRTWTADDGCDNVSTCIQTIFVQDTTPPTFAVGCQLVFDFFTSTPGVECPADAEISLVVGQIVGANENWVVAGQTIPSLSGCLFDNCTPPDSLVARVDSIDISGNGCDRTFTVFFTILDQCGNESADQFICIVNVHDDVAPVLTCPSDITINCDESTDPDNTGIATATDDCQPMINIFSSDEVIPGECPQEMTILRTWTADDGCDNVSTCVQTIFVQDTTPPTFDPECQLVIDLFTSTQGIECPEIAEISLVVGQIVGVNENWIVAGQTIPSLMGCLFDNCTPADSLVARVDSIDITGNTCLRTFTVFFTIIDQCGNESADQFVCVVNVQDDVAPVITCPGDVTISCDESTDPDDTGMATATDDCQTEVNIFSSDEIIPGECPQEMTILRTWTADDGCDNISTCVQTIFVQDTTPPTFDPACQLVFDFYTSTPGVDCPAAAEISLVVGQIVTQSENWTVAGQVIPNLGGCLFDNCTPADSIVARVDSIDISGNSCDRTFTVFFTILDQCGNESVDPFICVVNIHDDVAPVLTCPSDVTINCDESTDPDNTGIATATDDCQPMINIFSSDEVVPGECPQEMTILRTWTADDGCDNVSTCVQTIFVQDTTPPTFEPECQLVFDFFTSTPGVECPADATISISEGDIIGASENWIVAGQVIPSLMGCLFDNCSDPDSLVARVDSIPVTGDNCTRTFTVYFTIIDQCGNESVDPFVCVVNVHDDVAPVITCPGDVTIECDQSTLPDNTGTASATDDCQPEVIILSSDVVTPGECPQEMTITRTWTADDGCDNVSSCTQVITVIDTQAPEVTCPADITISCEEGTSPETTGQLTATDNCDPEPMITFSDLVLQGQCPQEMTILRNWFVTDACGNLNSGCIQTIMVVDTTGPVLTCAPDVFIECDESTLPDNTGFTTATDNCDPEVFITYSDNIIAFEVCPANYIIQRTWTATDACDNQSTCLQTITVDDTTPPDLVCPEDVTLDCFAATAPSNLPTEVTTYTNETGFLMATGAVNLESFESNPTATGQDVIPTANFVLTLAPSSTVNGVYNVEVAGSHATDGVNYVLTQFDQAGPAHTATFVFNDPINAFGMNITDWGDFGAGTLTFMNDAGDMYVVDVTPNPNANDMFFGVINPGMDFNQVIFTSDIFGEAYGLDEVYFGIATSTGTATATDNCDPLPFVNYSDVVIPGECPQEFTVERTWMATDDCLNTSTCVQIIAVRDDLGPDFTFCPSDVTIECDDSTSPDDLGYASATDFCDEEVEVSYSDVTIENPQAPCPQAYRIVRTWTALDDCGNTSICVQNIMLIDTTGPVITCPVDVTIECDQSLAPDNTGMATASDNCDPSPMIYIEDVVIPGPCLQSFTIQRTFSAVDACGNANFCVQTIVVEDTTPPDLVCPADITIECDEDTSTENTGMASATDNCDPGPFLITNSDAFGESNCPQEMVIFRTFFVADACGNSTSCQQIILVVDSTPPDMTCPEDVTIECGTDTSTETTGIASATDNCDPDILFDYTEVVTPGDCPQEMTILRTWIATDHCGNESQCIQTITVVDNTPPEITCPGDVTIECDEDTSVDNTGQATATDNCDPEPFVTNSDVITPGNCPQEMIITRTFTAADACGNTTTCVQTIQLIDTTPPQITCPAAVTVQCAAQVPPVNTGSVITSDNCDPMPVVTHVSDVTVNQTCVNRFMLNRTYRATDACGNSATCIQVITVFDSTPPSITCPANVTVQCATDVPPVNTGGVTASDNCAGPAPVVTFVSDVTVNQTCVNRFMLNRTYRATDACGNSATCVQVITVFDNTAPSITCPPNLTVQCAVDVPAPNPALVTASDNCSGGAPTVTFVSDVTVNQTCLNRYTLNRTYRATDICGNSATCVQVITVFDNTPPVITFEDPLLEGVANGGTIEIQCYGQDPEWEPPMFDANSVSAEDNCTGNVTITYSEILFDEGDCAVDGYINRYRLRWIATDACGNSSSATVFVNLVDTIPPVITGVPADITVNCDEIPDPPTVMATDECLCACIITYEQDGPYPGCQDGQVVTRTWTAKDDCGNMTIVQQHITLVDHEGPELEITQSEIAGVQDGSILEYTCNEGGIPAFYDDLSAESIYSPYACGGLPKIDFDKDVTVTRNCKHFGYIEQRIYTWIGTDQCGNQTKLSITVRLIDDEAPTILNVPDVACIGDPALEDVDVVDNCGTAFLTYWDVPVENPCGGGQAWRRTYEAYDPCGNYERDTVLLIQDDTPPVIYFTNKDLIGLGQGEFITTQCDNSEGYFTNWGLNDVEATDDCENVNIEFEQIVMQDYHCDEQTVVWLNLVWTATDMCGNSSSLFLYVYVEDHEPPTLENFKSEVTIGCGDELPEITASDNCSEVTVMVSDSIVPGNCEFEYDVIRTVIAKDACGNVTEAKQIVHVGDGSGPDIEGVEEEVCDDLSIPNVTAYDPCADEYVPVEMTQDTLDVPCQDGLVIERIWSAKDACGNESQVHQTIYVNDHTPPVIQIPTWSVILFFLDQEPNLVYLSQSSIIEKLNKLDENSVSVEDACDQLIIPEFTLDITYSEDCAEEGYYERRVYTWVATDACGNSSVVTFTVDIMDDVAPVLLNVPDDITVICDQLPPPAVVTADDYSQPVTVEYTQVIGPDNGEGHYTVKRQWTATDPCGNMTAAVQTILWIPDTYVACDIILPPLVNCNTHGVTIGSEVEGGIGPFTYEWEVQGEKCFIQAGQGTPEIDIYIGFSEVTIYLTVTDAYGCQTVCSATLDCLDPFENGLIGNPQVINPAVINNSELPLIPNGMDHLTELNFWPNPANSTVNIRFESAKAGEVRISFVNYLGQEVLADEIDAVRGINTRRIDVSNMLDGTYLMQVKTDNEVHTKTIVIIKNR